MKRILLVIAIAALVPAAVPEVASAHANWTIAGYQYLAVDGAAAGPTGYLNVPTGALFLNDPWTDDGFGGITNRDPVSHTFTECTAACNEIIGSAEGARFAIAVPGGQSASVEEVNAVNSLFENTTGTITIMCTVHPWMRAAVDLN